MAKLITNHDPFHIHKILGLFVLTNYIYRYFLLLKYGSAFPQDESPLRASMCVFAHGLLSWSSLLLPLPEKRNFRSPMIWKEFRLHSIIFATRHVICTLLTLNDLWPSSMGLRAFAKVCVVVGTSRAAALVTSIYGCNDKRTTNTMPYPKWTTPNQQKYIKYMYAKSQFVASNLSMLPDPSRNFFPMLAIQIAPLMMTLVRKGKASAMWYHRIYFLSLWMSFIAAIVRSYSAKEENGIFFTMAIFLLIKGRIAHGLPHWLLWSIHGFVMFYIYPLFIQPILVQTSFVTYLRYTFVLGIVPIGHMIHELILDPRPMKESIKHWPFLNFDDSFYESRFVLTKYHKDHVEKKDTWSQKKNN